MRTMLTDAIVEVQRELQVRGYVYPKLVAQGKLTQGEATRRMEALRFAQMLLRQSAEGQLPTAPTTGDR